MLLNVSHVHILLYANVLSDTDKSLKVIQKLLISSTADRDYSAQEMCHILLMFMASRDFVVLSLDRSRPVNECLTEDKPATVLTSVDHYMKRPTTPHFEGMKFTQNYKMPSSEGGQPTPRNKAVIVIVRPYLPPDPSGLKYDDYCRQKLMLYVPFRTFNSLMGSFFSSGTIIPPCFHHAYRMTFIGSTTTD